MSVSEIAEACGYDSLYAFSHAFKNYAKISPAEFRQRVKK
jgi:AraC-like DNA-binding protein